MPSRTLDEVLADPHLSEREFWRTVDGIRVPSLGFRFRDERSGGRDWEPVGAATAGRIRRRDPSSAGEGRPVPESTQPLAGVRILDLTHVWAGPLGTRILGDLGADIVKVERPMGRGGTSGTPGAGNYLGGEKGEDPWNRQGTFVKLNRNKKSLAIDLKKSRRASGFSGPRSGSRRGDRELQRPVDAGALKLGYDVLRAANEKIIYVSMPGYGRHGARIATGLRMALPSKR